MTTGPTFQIPDAAGRMNYSVRLADKSHVGQGIVRVNLRLSAMNVAMPSQINWLVVETGERKSGSSVSFDLRAKGEPYTLRLLFPGGEADVRDFKIDIKLEPDVVVR